MDLTQELEQMAQNNDTITRWQDLFSLTYTEAYRKLHSHRTNPFKTTLSNQNWELIRSEKEKLGYDKESYEYHMHQNETQPFKNTERASTNRTKTFLLILRDPLSTACQVQESLNLKSAPITLHGTDDEGNKTHFCRVTAHEKHLILQKHLPKISETWFIPDSLAQKDLSSFSKHPTLGISSSTMPQHRLSDADEVILPLQCQYPVYYFFYGTLCDSELLMRLLDLLDPPVYHKASVKGGRLTTWGGKYMGLIDDQNSKSEVLGLAYEVRSEDDEMRLRYYETDRYEVVRGLIRMDRNGGLEDVPGLTFRFIM